MGTVEAGAPVGVVGAGTMGAGIALVAAQAGHPVLLLDARAGAADDAVRSLREKRRGWEPAARSTRTTPPRPASGCRSRAPWPTWPGAGWWSRPSSRTSP
ncbi:hypothetical protein GCM10025868_24190 [Angustibacter aerolatus]|uniref:3-hydroxyacyl-CoA dehydrogenase NAD binding domain-containing protein n=1 Tax=Angustibacter aerolatus TaxID=1162965 RepID=A0ABQ6JJ78_9ACTN|nr:hypothetical protein GCM10025868_24190 [Angustibacter aerolatus]